MSRIAKMAGPAALLAVLAGAPPALAQSDLAAQNLIGRLLPQVRAQPGGGTRGLRIPDAGAPAPTIQPTVWPSAPTPAHAAPPPIRQASAPRPMTPPRETTAAEGQSAVSITVTFPSGSATLTPEAERALTPLGQALASAELRPYRFRIEGHTDTVGDPAQNQALSDRRAAAVRDYLSRTFGIETSRLDAVGYGASQLLVPTPAQMPEPRNRRVQVVNLGS